MESTAATCAICQSPLQADEESVACAGCNAPYHAGCWQENGGCAVYGCSEVPPTEARQALEIPVSYWGQENKPCPVCAAQILAAAVRCRHCGTTFASARPQNSEEFRHQAELEVRRPALRRATIWLFVLCITSCTAPVAAPLWANWYRHHREELQGLPSLHVALCKIGLAIGLTQTALIIILTAAFVVFHR